MIRIIIYGSIITLIFIKSKSSMIEFTEPIKCILFLNIMGCDTKINEPEHMVRY